MAKKKVTNLDCDDTHKFTKAGESIEGYYLGSKTIETDLGRSRLHVFGGEDGNFGIYGSAKLNELLAQVELGCMTTVVYGGKVKIGGGKTMHKYEVEYDDEVRVDVTSAAKESPNESEESPEEEESDDSDSEEENDIDEDTMAAGEEDEEEAPKKPITTKPLKAAKSPATVNAAAKNSVQNLLSKSKR